jgi:hypothetical protein
VDNNLVGRDGFIRAIRSTRQKGSTTSGGRRSGWSTRHVNKKTHLTLLIRIKKLLNESQQATLRDLRAKEPARHGGPPPPP